MSLGKYLTRNPNQKTAPMEEKMTAKRRTDLSLDQLIAIATGKVSAPSCYTCSGKNFECKNGVIPAEHAANDIGIIFSNTKDVVAEKALAEIMSINSNMAYLGYIHLYRRRSELLPETEASLKAYEKNPQNAENMKWIRNRIAELPGGC